MTDDTLPAADADHDCLEWLTDGRDDPALPDYITHHECRVCGEWFEHDTETGEYQVDR